MRERSKEKLEMRVGHKYEKPIDDNNNNISDAWKNTNCASHFCGGFYGFSKDTKYLSW